MLARVIAPLALLSLTLFSTSCGGPSVALHDDRLEVVHVSPSHGSVQVRRDPTITLGFSEPVDEGSLADNVSLVAEDSGGGTKEVDVRTFLDDEGYVVTIVPSNVLDGGTLHRLILSEGLSTSAGAVLSAPFRAEFVTRD